MCGIAGIASLRGAPVDLPELRAMRDHMAARGPDGMGEWLAPDASVGLAHRRLAIIDLSEAGAQPMASDDGTLLITFNGEIYNYRELRGRLQANGHVLKTESDTEVLLHLYAEKGEEMLHDLRGMFAFAIWDAEKRRLFCARDAFGIKPLYYSASGGMFRFASQVKALLRTPIDREPSAGGHVGFFLWGSVPEPFTLYRDIHALPAGHKLIVDQQGVGEPKAWLRITEVLAESAEAPAHGTRGFAIEAISEAVHDSVVAHQVADVPVGIFLSAGIDSGMIANTAVTNGAHSYTLTLGFREFAGTSNDEVPLAEEVARNLGAWHSTLMTSREDFEREGEKLFATMDQPSIDGVNTWFVARAAAQMDLKVALSGLGGDELFGSYPSFREVPGLVRATRPLHGAPGLGRMMRAISAPVLRQFTSPKYAGLLEYGNDLGSAYLLRRCLFAPWELSGLLGADLAKRGLMELQTCRQLAATVKDIGRDRLAVSALEMEWYMRNQLLRDADWAGTGQAMEIRVPFLDVQLLRKSAPWFARYPDIRKAEIAAVAAPKLPPSLLQRPKTGFSVPVREWIRPPGEQRQERGLRGWAKYVHGRFGGMQG